MKWKTLAITIVLNMFALLFFNVIYEYISLADRFNQIEDLMYPAIESALEASTAGEELFSDKSDESASGMLSEASSATSRNTNAERNGRHTMVRSPYATDAELVDNGVLFYNRNSKKIEKVDVYKLAIYYGINDKLPIKSEDLESGVFDQLDTAAVFSYLYGGVGTSYNSPNLEWANTNKLTKRAYGGETDSPTTNLWETTSKYSPTLDNRKPNDDSTNALENLGITVTEWGKKANNFQKFYEKVGNKVYSYSYMKCKPTDGSEGFDIACATKEPSVPSFFFQTSDTVFPTLAQMGLELDSKYNMADKGGGVSSEYMLDNFCSSIKIGKKSLTEINDHIAGLKASYYFLTPYSLGVSYVPMSVFKPVFTSVLDANIRLRKASSGSTAFASDVFQQADGCVDTSVYSSPSGAEEHSSEFGQSAYGLDVISNNAGTNTDAKLGKEYIVNDGYIEYDLNSISCKVDYFVVDLFDSTNNNPYITTYLIGTKKMGNKNDSDNKSGTIEAKTVEDYNKNYNQNPKINAYYDILSSELTKDVSGLRIVAKVTTKVKIHTPYRSSILQWASKRIHNEKSVGGNHFGVKQWSYDVSTKNGKIVEDDDDLWYECETYYSNVR